MKNIPTHIKVVVAALIAVIALNFLVSTFDKGVNLFNTNKDKVSSYNKLTQEQVTNYDGYYQAFIDKQDNANISKETFIQVTDIIMSRRADGQNVSWKWLQENQPIPYNEFTDFYKELSAFISVRYEDNMRIEREKQQIVQEQNLLISKYPNNIFNKLLKIDSLKYKAGYISDLTKNRFK